MIFTSHIFLFVFLPLAIILYWVSPTVKCRKAVIALSSIVFIGSWSIYYLAMFLSLCLVNFSILKLLIRHEKLKRRMLFIGVMMNLSVLAVFKYYGFIAGNVNLISPISLPYHNLILPVGISYYTFVFIGYLADVRKGDASPPESLFDFMNYMTFFPKFISGPITRANDFGAQMSSMPGRLIPGQAATGLSLIAIGLAKKILIADTIARSINGPLWSQWDQLGFWGAWLAAVGFSLQLYFDFSGYCDIAVGIGKLFGFELPFNFNAPYRALNFRDFWRRWHISLSSWLTEHIYIPLGGSRKSKTATYINIMITMLLCGLWHGAAWTFIVWGALHGLMLVLYRLTRKQWDSIPRFVMRPLMLVLITMSWVFFRAPSVDAGIAVIKAMLGMSGFDSVTILWSNTGLAAAVAAGIVFTQFFKDAPDIVPSYNWKWAIGLSALLFAAIFMMDGGTGFIYLRF